MLIEEVFTLSFKLGMLFLLQHKNNISCDSIRLQEENKQDVSEL